MEVIEALRKRRSILKASRGQDNGWFLIYQGTRMAELYQPDFVDMFWVGYTMKPLVEDGELLQLLSTQEFWDRCSQMHFEDRQTGMMVRGAHSGASTRFDGLRSGDACLADNLWTPGVTVLVEIDTYD